jgi:ketosteroid isomerase-like protein
MTMRKISYLVCLVAALAGLACEENAVDREQLKSELMQVDRDFSALSVERGMRAAFGAYMADDVVIYSAGQMPVLGREKALPLYPEGTDVVLKWEPFFADVAQSGDLGYTLGSYTLTGTAEDGSPSVSRGHYVSIWKRQADGTWKFVFDTGHQGPADEESP